MIREIQRELFIMQDTDYKLFQSALIPTISSDTVIGVRTPLLRAYAGKIAGTVKENAILTTMPHEYFEENNLHGILIGKSKSFDDCITLLDEFLPHVDNWATCDMMSPKVLKKDKESLLGHIDRWLESEHIYTVRFAVKCLLDFYLDEGFSEDILARASQINREEYYIEMVCAWFFATALTKQYDSTLPYLTQKRLSPSLHNKTIRKALESLRISDEVKAYLKTLRI